MGYSRTCEGAGIDNFAILIFGQDAREARRVGWQLWKGLVYGEGDVDAFFDFGVRWLRNAPGCILRLDRREPYATEKTIEITCKDCERWGQEIRLGRCEDCRDRILS